MSKATKSRLCFHDESEHRLFGVMDSQDNPVLLPTSRTDVGDLKPAVALKKMEFTEKKNQFERAHIHEPGKSSLQICKSSSRYFIPLNLMLLERIIQPVACAT